jgi:hypothetical protein
MELISLVVGAGDRRTWAGAPDRAPPIDFSRGQIYGRTGDASTTPLWEYPRPTFISQHGKKKAARSAGHRRTGSAERGRREHGEKKELALPAQKNWRVVQNSFLRRASFFFFFPLNTAAQVRLLSLFKKKDSALSTCKTHWGAGELFFLLRWLVLSCSSLSWRPDPSLFPGVAP